MPGSELSSCIATICGAAVFVVGHLERRPLRTCYSRCTIGAAAKRSFYFLLGDGMNLHLSIGPIASLVAGILILVVPRLLNYIVAIYLIFIGLLGLSLGYV
jgi:hypothetical protein